MSTSLSRFFSSRASSTFPASSSDCFICSSSTISLASSNSLGISSPSGFMPVLLMYLSSSFNWLTPLLISMPSPIAEAPPLKILKVWLKDAAISSNFWASIVDMENNITKKQSRRFIRSAKVDCHAGAPFGGSSGFLLANLFTSLGRITCTICRSQEGFQFLFNNTWVFTCLNRKQSFNSNLFHCNFICII